MHRRDLSSFSIQQISKIYDDVQTGYRVLKITHIVEITHINFWPLKFRDPEEGLIQKIYNGKSPTVYRSDCKKNGSLYFFPVLKSNTPQPAKNELKTASEAE